jgi:hypothetical protein
LENEDLDEERLEFPLAREAEFLQSVDAVAPKQPRPKPPARPDPDHPFYKVFAAMEAGQVEEAAGLLKRIRIRGEEREGYDPTRGAALEFFGDCCRESRPEMALWFYERSLDFLHRWGSEATSGGEGFARQMEIKPVELKRDGLRAQLGQ